MKQARETVEGRIARLPDEQQEIARALRELIRSAAPDLGETLKWGHPCYTGAGNVCSIVAYRGHVNLAFFRGTELDDPDSLLEGTGKGMRHVTIRAAADIPRQALTALLRAAARLDREG